MKQKAVQSAKPQTIQSAPSVRWWLYISAAIIIFLAICCSNNGSYFTKKVLGLLGGATILCMLVFADQQRVKRLMTPPAFAIFAYILLAGISTLYAKSGKFAIAEFSCLLVAFAVFMAIVLFAKEEKIALRRTVAVLACAAAPVGILSIDAASCNILMRPFRVLMEVICPGYGDTGALFNARLLTIFGNPNTYAGLMSIACLLSIWLVLTAETRRQKVLCTIVLMINAVSYLLAFSMGSLGVFVVACLLMLALSPKEGRAGLFFLLVQTAVVALIVGGISVKGFGDTATGSPLPLLMLVVGCALACVLEIYVREKLSAVLADQGKLFISVIAGIVVLVAVYFIAALNVTGAYTFGTEGYFRRTINLPAGEYTLAVESSAPVQIRVSYKDLNNLVQNNDTELANTLSDKPITFTVPEDSKIVFFTFTCNQPGVIVQSATYTGTQENSLKLGYKLFPAFIADRIQDLAVNGNMVQRGVYRQDAIKLWLTSPIFGRGLGGFENGIASVQDYYYETKYAHNHYVEALCDLGVLGLAAFLAILGTAVWALVKSRKEKPLAVMLLAACVLQMFGQAITDVIWSVGCCLPMFFAVLALVVLYCGDSLRLKLPQTSAGGAVRWPVMAFSAIFVILIGLNLIAQMVFASSSLTLDDLKLCASIDLFEKNDYKLSYLISGGNEEGVADQYAADLAKVESNSITIPLSQYYVAAGQYDQALDVLDHGITYMRADAEAWQQMFDLYETMLNPVGNVTGVQLLMDDSYIKRMVNGYEQLCQTNAAQLDNVLLTAKNNAFLNRLLAVAALNPYDTTQALTILSKTGLDSSTLPDADNNGVPDNVTVQTGTVTLQDNGVFTAQTDATISVMTQVPADGDYILRIQASDLGGITGVTINGNPMTLDTATGCCAAFSDQSDTPTEMILSVKAGTTVNHILYAQD